MAPKHTILIVDDDPLNTRILSEKIKSEQYRIITAENGVECLQKFEKHSPDLILLDIMMPEMNGIEACQKIKADPANRDLPILFITALTETKHKVEGLEAGAVDYITKPFNTTEVKARVATHLALKIARDALKNHNQILDETVKARTTELQSANAQLKREIADRKRALDQLQASEAKSRAIIAALPDNVFKTNKDGVVLSCKGSGPHPLLQSPDNIGKALDQIMPSDIAAQTLDHIRQTLRNGNTNVHEYRLTENGSWQAFESRFVQVAAEEALVITRDITDTKKREKTLRDREAQLRKENRRLKSSIKERYRFGDIIGKSECMQAVYNLILEAAGSDASVVIYGESGTGKELVANAIHSMGDRHHQAFVPVNCGAIPDNLLESEFFGYKKGAFSGADKDKRGYLDEAAGGTLFLDEVGDIGLNMQVKLLRVIDGNGFTPVGGNQVQKPDVRFMVASNKMLSDMVSDGAMREDFFYRIHIIPIQLPPLRERREDIPLLIDHFMKLYAADAKNIPPIRDDVYQSLLNYDWPGNVRELQNTLHRFVTLKKIDLMGATRTPEISTAHLEPELDPELFDYWGLIQEFEKKIIAHALEKHRWHKEKTAASLGIPRRTFYRKLKKLGINAA